jgi:hypothetical protein
LAEPVRHPKLWVVLRHPTEWVAFDGECSSVSEVSAQAEKTSEKYQTSKIIVAESVGGFLDDKQIVIEGSKTVPAAKPGKMSPLHKGKPFGRNRRTKQLRFWIIYNPKDSAGRRSYRVHYDFALAVAEAMRLAKTYPGQTLLLMESILGVINTAELGKEFVFVVDTYRDSLGRSGRKKKSRPR